jgi:hypothetical protein
MKVEGKLGRERGSGEEGGRTREGKGGECDQSKLCTCIKMS